MQTPSRPRLAQAAGATLGGVALAAAAFTPVGTASAAPGDSAECPLAKPVHNLEPGEPVTALTVSAGTTPDSLTGEVVGVIEGGINPDVDMIMVKLDGSRVTDADGDVDAGIWAGMSGSPVYAANGRLIGAVSYGLSFSPSEYAGVTPAAAMYDVMGMTGAERSRAAARVDVPRYAERQMTADGVPNADGQSYQRLPLPVSVSGGLSAARLDRAADRAGTNVRLATGGGRASLAEPADELVPGGNLAASMSYGDVTMAGIGTTTAVCGDQVVGFGHPMLWSGPSELTVHGANALFIQRDTVFGSFKVANPTAPIGSILQDRWAAIAGVLGVTPATTSIESSTTFGNRSREGETFVSVADATGFVTAIHGLVNSDTVYDGIRGGTSTMGWRITVERESGDSVTIHRSDMFSNGYDITFETPWAVAEDVERVIQNEFEDVAVTSVDMQISYEEAIRQGRLGKIEVRKHGEWQVVRRHERLRAARGSELPLRVTVQPTSDDSVEQRVRLTAKVPKTKRDRGYLVIQGGQSAWERPRGLQSFDELVEWLEGQAPSNSVNSTVFVRGQNSPAPNEDTVETDAPVRGGRFISLRITG